MASIHDFEVGEALQEYRCDRLAGSYGQEGPALPVTLLFCAADNRVGGEQSFIHSTNTDLMTAGQSTMSRLGLPPEIEGVNRWDSGEGLEVIGRQ